MADTIEQGVLFLRQELAAYDSIWQQTVYPERWGANGLHHQAISDLPLGIDRMVVGRIDSTANAVIYGGRATDIPLVNLGITEDEYNTRIILARAEWNWLDLAKQEQANKNALLPQRNLVKEYMNALKVAIDQRTHELVTFGDDGMAGLLSSPIVELTQETEDLNTLAADALYDKIRGYLTIFKKRSLLTATAMKMLITTDLKSALSKRFPDSDSSPLEMLINEEKGLHVREISEVNELNSSFLEQYGVHAPGTNKDRLMIYEDRLPQGEEITDEEMQQSAIQRHFFPMDRTPEIQTDSLNYQVTAYSATTEMQFRKSFCAHYIDYPKAV